MDIDQLAVIAVLMLTLWSAFGAMLYMTLSGTAFRPKGALLASIIVLVCGPLVWIIVFQAAQAILEHDKRMEERNDQHRH